MRLSLMIIYACIQVKQNEFGWLYGKLYPSWFGLLYTPDITQKFIEDVYDEIKDYTKQYDCRIGITQLPTHGFTVRVLSNLTQEIEEVLTRAQAYIADKLYHRQLDFLRKY